MKVVGSEIAAEDMGVVTTNTALSSLSMAASQNSSSPVSFKNHVSVLPPPSWISISRRPLYKWLEYRKGIPAKVNYMAWVLGRRLYILPRGEKMCIALLTVANILPRDHYWPGLLAIILPLSQVTYCNAHSLFPVQIGTACVFQVQVGIYSIYCIIFSLQSVFCARVGV